MHWRFTDHIVLCRVPPVVTSVVAEVDLAEEEAEAVVAVASMVVEAVHTVLHPSCHQSCRFVWTIA